MIHEKDMKSRLVALETQVWEALVRGDSAADGALLTDDFLGVYPDGFAGKEAHTGQVSDGPSFAAYDLSDLHLRQISESAGLLSYRAAYQRVDSEVWEVMLITSLWELREGQWRNSFSQDTLLHK
ncbi:nuclear transport factor 2 family protein [Shimia sp. R11_0]|nr:nuclear transport factor 2 family protein [Shimia sp. R11_0]